MDAGGGGAPTGFKKATTGKKVKNKKSKDGKERHNSKAFTFSGGTKSIQKKVQFSLDKLAKKEQANLLVNKTPDAPPPYVVVVQGPPKCGKTTLIKSLIKHYTKQNVNDIQGPVTIVTAMHRRITFYEAP